MRLVLVVDPIVMSEPYNRLQEEHGKLDDDSMAANDRNVQAKFTAFFSVVIGVHSVMFVFALIFLYCEDPVPKFAECLSTNTVFAEYYPQVHEVGGNLTLPTLPGQVGNNFTCVAQFSDSRMFVVGIAFGGAVMTAGLLCHRHLPVQHPAIPYIDVVAITAVYVGHMNCIFISGFAHYLGRLYILPSLQGAQVGGWVGGWVGVNSAMRR